MVTEMCGRLQTKLSQTRLRYNVILWETVLFLVFAVFEIQNCLSNTFPSPISEWALNSSLNCSCFDAKQLYGLHLTLGPCLCEHVNVDVHNCECMQPHIVYHCVCVFTLVFVYHSALGAWEWSVVMELCAGEPGQ